MIGYLRRISDINAGVILLLAVFTTGLLMSVSTRAADVVEAQPQWVPDTKQAQSSKEAPQRLALGMHLAPLVDLPAAAQGAANKLEALEERKRKGLQPLQVGFERSITAQTINFTLKDALAGGSATGAQFLTTEGSDVIWSSRIRVAGAFAFRLHLEDVKLPRSARIWIYNVAGNYLGPFDRKRIDDDGGLWLPPLEGSVMFLEIRVSADDLEKGASVGFTLRQISELVPFSNISDGPTPSPNVWTDCDIDVSCEEGAPFNIDDYARSVARLLFTADEGGSYLCSGALVNDQVDGTFAPWLLTANHCFDSDTEANSLVSYFDYRTDTCGGVVPSLGSVPQVNGATMMASNPSSDFSFIHLDELPTGRFFLGWTTGSPAADQTMYSISHPAGQVANYSTSSFNETGGIVCSGFDRPDFHYSSGVTGSTTGGSSGSPVYSSTGQIFGQLYGSCNFPDADDCSYSTYNRVDGAFGTTYTSISGWLDGTLPPPDPTEPCVDDEFEEDDVCFGNFVGIGNFQDHKHCDEDWVYFGATAGHTYVIETTAIIGDTTLALHDSCGPEFAFDDDGGVGVASRIEWTADANATIDIRVRQFSDAYTDGEQYTISVTDITPSEATLTVIKTVVNDGGGTAVASDWTMDVTATNPSSNNFPGAESPGVEITIDAGAYSVDESGGPGGYVKSLSAGCSGTLAAAESATCTITNTFTNGASQLIYADPSSVGAQAGGPVQIDIQYDVSDNDPTLTGIGIRVHYDSSKLIFDSVGLTLAFGRLFDPALVTPEVDSSDFDGDASTDRYLSMAWVDFAGQWPGSLFEFLAAVHFNTAGNFTGSTQVNFTASDLAAGYSLSATPAEVFEQLCNLDADGNGSYGALTDGVLIVRYLFGFTGTQLTDGAIGNGATRADAASIIAYLDSCRTAMLDVDGNGSEGALTDGVLIVRYLFGFTGTQLTDGAIGNGATRTDAASIIAFLDTVTPALNQASGQRMAASIGEQRVSSRVDRSSSKRNGKTFDVHVDYSATELFHTGLGIRMHFDSSMLRLLDLSNIYSPGALQHQFQDDTLDFDGDPKTDRYINIAWMDPLGNWPGINQAQLFTATFLKIKAKGTAATTIRYSVADTAAGADVSFDPVQIGSGHGKAKKNK